MRARGVWVIAAVAVPMLVGWPLSAVAASPSFTVSPKSGGAGTAISVRSVTVCRLPAGVTGAPLAEVTLVQGSRVVAKGRFTATASGSWHGVLHVGSSAAPGPAHVDAFCLASAQAEGALFKYQSVSFTVSGLPRTGAGPELTLSAGAGALLLLAGSLLLVASRRRPAAGLMRR